MEIMNAITETNNFNICDIQDSNYWNISHTRNNRILSERKLARFVASLICQTHEIGNRLKIIAQQKYISVKEEESIKKSCELYEQMVDLIKDWKKLHFQNKSDRQYTMNSWSQQIFESDNKNSMLII